MAKKKTEPTFQEAVIETPEPMSAEEAIKRTAAPKHAKTPKHAELKKPFRFFKR